ncbi:MAG: response regulator transcription factor [Anaerolineales bacterium]|nr:response regulator transcription factor [Anaerolineales bacterium]
MKPSKVITVFVADDHPLALEGVRSILSRAPDIKIVGKAQDGNEIKPLVAKLRPRILLLDLRMPNLSPVELEKWVRENYPETITLVFTAHHRAAYLADMMDAGAAGYLDKTLEKGNLLDAIRRAARGEILYEKEQIEEAQRWREEVAIKWESLSDREREVLILLAGGCDNCTIATTLGISVNTVEKHLKNIYKRLGVSSRTEAVHWWAKKGTDFRN